MKNYLLKPLYASLPRNFIFILIVLISSCVDQNTKLAGDFALTGFDFDVEPPKAELNSSHSPYTNSHNVKININTGTELINCASFDRFAITESNNEPLPSRFSYTCSQAGTQTVSYSLQDTTQGERTLYLWSMDDRTQKVSSSSELEFILDTTAPVGSISTIDNFIQGGSTHYLTLTSSDNFELASESLTISHNSSGLWQEISNESTLFLGTRVVFPVMDSSNSLLRYLLTDAAGNETEIISNTFILDSTPATLSITDPALFIAGASTYDINYNIFDLNGIDSWSLAYSKDDGVSYTTLQTSPSKPYSWSVPSDDTNFAKIRLAATDSAGNTNYVTSTTFSVDSTPPALSLTNPPTWLQGGSIYNINFSATDSGGLSSFTLEYAQDGTNFTTLTTTNAPPFAWNVPSVNITSVAKLRITAVDMGGNSSTQTSSVFGIDSSAPAATLNNMNAVIRGGVNNTVSLTSSDTASGVASANLFFSNDSGATFSLVTALPSTPTYSWASPALDVETAKLRYVVTDGVGNTTTVENSIFEIDSTAPASTLNSPTARVRGGDTLSLIFTATDKNSINSLSLEYASDGTNFSVLSSSPTSPYSWNVPSVNTSSSRLRLVSTDTVGNQTTIQSSSFEIDSTPSPAPSLSLNSDLYTNQTAVTLTMANCSDIDSIFINESSAPSRGDSGWQSCTTNVGAITYTLPTVEGLHTLKAWTKDDVGNVSLTATDVTLYYDVTDPVLVFSTPSMLAGSNTFTVNWTLTELYINNTESFNVDYWNGSAWIDLIDQAATTGPHSTQSFSASWTTPSLDREDILLRVQVTDLAGNSSSAQTSVFEIDSTPPASTLTSPPSLLKGGNTLAVNFTATDKNGINSLLLQYAADGVNYTTIATSPTSPYSWTIPSDDVSAAKLRLVSQDPVGNQTTIQSSAFEIDSTAPSAPPISRHTAQYTNVTATSFTMASCSQHYDEILINTGASPSVGDSAWQTCSTTAGAITYTIASTQGPHTLSAWVKDDAGNISATSTDFTIYYDVTSPVISVTNPGILAGSTTYTMNWNLTETYINNTQSFNVDYWNGSSWIDIATVAATTGPHSAQAFSTSWTTPTLNRADIKLRVQISDLAGNSQLSQSTTFEIDSIDPNLTIASPAANSYHKASLVMTGSCETGLPINFSGALQEDFAVTCSGGSYSQTLNFSDNDGNKLIVASQTDAAGNTTTVSRTFIRDEVAPILALSSGTNPDFTNQNQPNTWGGTCEGNYTITITGDQSTTIPCSSGSWSWTAGAKTSDGTYSYSLTQTDAAGNTSTPALSLSWQRDATPPVFNMGSPIIISAGQTKSDTNNQSQISFSGTCEGTNVINISGTQTDAISCSASSWTWSTNTVSTDATRSYTFIQSDSAGNTVSLVYQWIRDTTGPELFITENLLKSNTNTVTFSGTCETGIDIAISGPETNTVTCPSGTWSYTTNSRTGDNTRNYTFEQTLATPPYNSTSVLGTWIRETNIPTISHYSTSASSPSRKPFIPVDLTATSQNSSVYIKKICFQSTGATQPLATDKCWLEVDSPSVGQPLAQTLNLDEYSILLGWEPQLYNSYAFVMDEAGNISNNASSIGVDRLQITYDPGVAPVLFDVIAANNGSASIPPTRSDSSVPPGSDVFIRWKVTDNFALPTGAIALYYTTDEKTFTAITGAEALNQNTDYGCGITLDTDEGCFKWVGGSPVSVAYKIQVSATDTTDITTQQTTNILNSAQLKIIAGNTDNGIGGSAQTATFSIEGDVDDYDGRGIVFTDEGDMYYVDPDRGILTVDEEDGSLIVFIPTTGSSTGDGGSATSATLNYPTAITLDYQGRMLIFDRNRIRRVNLNLAVPNIDTIIGGGSNTSDTVSNPLDLSIETMNNTSREEDGMSFFAMPNGNIVFWSERPRHNRGATLPRIRIFNNATGQITSKYFSGTGDWRNASQDLSKCYLYMFGVSFDENSDFNYALGMSQHRSSYSGCDDAEEEYRIKFDPTTFVAEAPDNNSYSHYTHYPYTGMDGNLYQVISRNYVMKIDPATGSWTRVLGSGTRGECLDGEVATDCNMHIMNFFVSATGKFYFGDRGAIRTVNDSGEVVTIFGQKRTYGDGVLAINGRFDLTQSVFRLNNGNYIVGDHGGSYLKEFSVEGNIDILAGNGNYAVIDKDLPAIGNTVTYTDHMAVDPANGNVYMARNHSYGDILMLNHATGNWSQVIGDVNSSGINYFEADGELGADVNSHNNQSRGRISGFGDNKLALARIRYNSSELRYEDSMLKLYDRSDNFKQSHMMGVTGWPSDNNTRRFCTGAQTSTTASTCEVPASYDTLSNIDYDSTDDKWIIAIAIGGTGRDVYYYHEDTDNIQRVAYLAQAIENWYEHVRYGGVEKLYYCSSSGIIRVHNLDTDTDEGHLSWPMSNMKCVGRKAAYNSVNHSIVFPFEQNGLYGIAEYFIP